MQGVEQVSELSNVGMRAACANAPTSHVLRQGSLSALSGSSFNDVPLMLRGLADIDLACRGGLVFLRD